MLSELDMSAALVYNTHATIFLDQLNSYDEKEAVSKQPNQKRKTSGTPRRTTICAKGKNAKPRVDVSIEKTAEETRKKFGISIDDVRKLDKLCLNGPASFGSAKRLQCLSILLMKKIKMYLETKPSFTEYHLLRLGFLRLKIVVNDIKEIWTVDVANVDKLAKYSHSVKYLLVAVDCFSRLGY